MSGCPAGGRNRAGLAAAGMLFHPVIVDPAGILNQSRSLLVQSEIRDLRRHLRDRFFPAHLSQYSASRRSAPLYWQLGAVQALGAMALRAMAVQGKLFAISPAAHDKLGALNDRIAQIQQQLTSGSDRENRDKSRS